MLEHRFRSWYLFNRRWFRALTVVNNFSRECLAFHAGQSLLSGDVVAVMEHLRLMQNRVQIRIQADNGPEFISKTQDKWAYENKVTMDLSPWNAYR